MTPLGDNTIFHGPARQLPEGLSIAHTMAITRAERQWIKCQDIENNSCLLASVFTIVLLQVRTLWSIAKSHLWIWKQRKSSG